MPARRVAASLRQQASCDCKINVELIVKAPERFETNEWGEEAADRRV